MIDDARLDMLVDGELDEAERRQVLSRLDADPDGWRRCALAFLETQSWREEMRAISRGPAPETPIARSESRGSSRPLRTVLAMTACFLLALGLGLAIDDILGRQESADPAMQVAGVQPPEEPVGTEPPAAPSSEPADPQDLPYQYVAIPAHDHSSGEFDLIRMPVLPHEFLDEGWPRQIPSALPSHVVHSLQQQGHDVVQQRRLVPYQAVDGSRVVFPVDEIELVPVGMRGYQ
jgi:hypothetical protein